jgi:hypothetical protein
MSRLKQAYTLSLSLDINFEPCYYLTMNRMSHRYGDGDQHGHLIPVWMAKATTVRTPSWDAEGLHATICSIAVLVDVRLSA